MIKLPYFAAALLAVTPVAAQDYEARADVVVAPMAEAHGEPETIAIDIRDGGRKIWSGSLRIGPKYGSASFSQSTSEFAPGCPGKAGDSDRSYSTQNRINLNIHRNNWQQEPDSFNVNINSVTPLAACQGNGTNTIGFQRIVDLPVGQTVVVAGEGGLSVRLTRRP